MKRRWIQLGIILLLSVSLFPSTAIGANTASFSLSWNHSDAAIGQEIVVTVKGEQIRDLYGYEIRLTYDTRLLRFKDAAALWSGFAVPATDKDGEIVFAHTKIGKSKGELGSVEIAKFKFEAIGAGDAAITLKQVKTVDSNIQMVETTPQIKASLPISSQLAPFSDLEGHWAKSAIEQAALKGIVNGYPDHTFRPDAKINRAEFTVLLANAVKLSAEADKPLDYADKDLIPEWAVPSVERASAAGVINGYADRTFRWNNSITRAEMTVMIVRAAQLAGGGGQPAPGFADDSSIPAWAYQAVSVAKANGLIQGKTNNRFDPSGSATRAEAAVIILNVLKSMENFSGN